MTSGVLGVGDLRVARIVDMRRRPFDAAGFLPDSSPATLATLNDAIPAGRYDAEAKALLLDFAGYLIWGGGPVILVDTAIGCDKPRPEAYGWNRRTDRGFLEAIAALGFPADRVDIVVNTHLHSDHVGWNTSLVAGRWRPTFRNARYLISAAEIESSRAGYAADPEFNNGCHADSVVPLLDAGVVDPVTGPVRLADGVTLAPLPGHTPGNLVVRVASGGARAVIAGDAIHHEFQFARPWWSTAYCDDPAMSATSRTGLLAEVAGTGAALLAAHFPPCRVGVAGAAFRWMPLDPAP